MTENVAVLLRGPPCSGKTTVGRALLRAVGSTKEEPIKLDDGWDTDEWRFAGGSNRYADLRGHEDRVIVLELGWGEPSGEHFPGSTKNPKEWFEVLRQEGRRVHLVQLRAHPFELLRRASERRMPGWTEIALFRNGQYENDVDVLALPARVGIEEQVIDTTSANVDAVVSLILSKIDRTSHA